MNWRLQRSLLAMFGLGVIAGAAMNLRVTTVRVTIIPTPLADEATIWLQTHRDG